MNVNHHHTPARVQVYNGRCRISKQKEFEKPKSRHAVKGGSKKRNACFKQKTRYLQAAIRIHLQIPPLISGGDLQGTSKGGTRA